MSTDGGGSGSQLPAGRLPGDNWEAHWEDFAEAVEANPAQAFRRRLILAALDLPARKDPPRILDVGSGQGDMARDLSRTEPRAEIRGIDLSEAGVRISRQKVPTAEFVAADLMTTVQARQGWESWATHGVCSELLEHVEDPVEVLRNVRPLFAPGAKLVVTVPSGPRSAFDLHIGHRRHFTADQLQAVLRHSGYEVERVDRAGFPFFNLYRCVVILRGKRLIQDAGSNRGLPWLARAVMACFRLLLRFTWTKFGPGWQLVALARVPSKASP